MKKIKEFLKEYKSFILVTVISLIIFNIKLPYYVLAPGGIIPIDDRIESSIKKDSDGSINLLYVTQYDGNISSLLLSLFMKNWDVFELKTNQISSESVEEIHSRDEVMLHNAIQNAIFVAYNEAGKDIKIKDKKNIVIGTTIDNSLKIKDEIISINDIEIENINTVRDIINNTEVGDKVKVKIIRNKKELEYDIPVVLEENRKVIGVMIITNYEYELDPKIEIDFKKSEGGSSGGVMTAVSIYNAITEKDITNNLKIAGTGTIDINGNVGEIDGVKYKIMGANKNKMDIVFVPKNNYEEAIKTKKDNNYNLEIVSINTFSDVINYLENYKK